MNIPIHTKLVNFILKIYTYRFILRSDSTLIEEITSREEIKNVNNVILVETNTPLILG